MFVRAKAWARLGCWRDNVFVERVWRSVKHEDVYLKAYDGVSDTWRSLVLYLEFCNARRPHPGSQREHPGHGLLQRAADDEGFSEMG